MINSVLDGFDKNGTQVKVIVEFNDKCVEKVYQKKTDGILALIEIINETGVYKLTTIPDFGNYMAYLECGKVFS